MDKNKYVIFDADDGAFVSAVYDEYDQFLDEPGWTDRVESALKFSYEEDADYIMGMVLEHSEQPFNLMIGLAKPPKKLQKPVDPELAIRYIQDTLETRGVTFRDIEADIIQGQAAYHEYSPYEAHEALMKVLSKMEVQNAFLVGMELDKLATQQSLSSPLQTLLEEDEPNFGIDEEIALGVAGLYGSIAKSNFGYLDKAKVGSVGVINEVGKHFKKTGEGYVTTMLDDMVAAVIASSEAYLAKKEVK